MGITNTWATIPGFAGPAVVGLLTEKHVSCMISFYSYCISTVTTGKALNSSYRKRKKQRNKNISDRIVNNRSMEERAVLILK